MFTIIVIQEWFKTGEMKSATVISIHGKNAEIDFIEGTINGISLK
ncbi:hypothetical protein [Caminicella sporogenes]|nr:hypothetical protein [Caminicella sporogenes]WIF95039.1 hypothetical protein QNI18_12375 [Caminicella sporogenes]